MATQWQQEIVTKVRQHALANYMVDGWDFVVETWSDADIRFATAGCRKVETAIAAVRSHILPLAAYRLDVQGA